MSKTDSMNHFRELSDAIDKLGEHAESRGWMFIGLIGKAEAVEGQEVEHTILDGGVFGVEHANPMTLIAWLIARTAVASGTSVKSICEVVESSAIDMIGNFVDKGGT